MSRWNSMEASSSTGWRAAVRRTWPTWWLAASRYHRPQLPDLQRKNENPAHWGEKHGDGSGEGGCGGGDLHGSVGPLVHLAGSAVPSAVPVRVRLLRPETCEWDERGRRPVRCGIFHLSVGKLSIVPRRDCSHWCNRTEAECKSTGRSWWSVAGDHASMSGFRRNRKNFRHFFFYTCRIIQQSGGSFLKMLLLAIIRSHDLQQHQRCVVICDDVLYIPPFNQCVFSSYIFFKYLPIFIFPIDPPIHQVFKVKL